MLRRVRTPITPIVNSAALKNQIMMMSEPFVYSACVFLLRQHDGTDDRHEQQNGCDLERQQICRVKASPTCSEFPGHRNRRRAPRCGGSTNESLPLTDDVCESRRSECAEVISAIVHCRLNWRS